jgi:hypothetical protein
MLGNMKTRNDIIFHKIKHNAILCFWAQLQCDEYNKNLLSSLSTKLEMVSLEHANRGWKHLFHLF